MTYFSDREFGEQPPTTEEIGDSVWAGFRAIVNAKIEDGSFAVEFPINCPDGRGPFATDRDAFEAVLLAEIPRLPEEALMSLFDNPPHVAEILDLLEFCWRHVAAPINGSTHSHFGHVHLSFDRELGRDKFREQVNSIFTRNQIAYTLTDDGRIERLGPPVLREELASTEFVTGDPELDRILESARRKFFDPSEEIRREALLELWDAWERLKTTGEGSNKKDQITSLLDGAAGSASPKFRDSLETEALELTSIGNNHQIRHTEVTQEKIENREHVDYLFHRLFSLIHLIINTQGK